MSLGVRIQLDDCPQRKDGVRGGDTQSLGFPGGPCAPLPIFIWTLAHSFRSILICVLLLASSLNLRAYAMPAPPIVEGQQLHIVAADKVAAVRTQPPTDLSSGPEIPIAQPMPPIDARFYFQSGVASLGRRDYTKAEIEFTEAIRLNSNFAAAYLSRGNTYSNQGDLDAAIRDYCDAIRIEPNYAIAYYNRGAVYQRKGKFNKAFRDYSEAIRIDQKFASAYNNRGVVYGHKGDYNKAISDFTEAIRLDPKYALAYHNRGLVYLHAGMSAKANADFAAARSVVSP
jgi:tetratricopeptide (TPR) repeat protein